MHKKEMCFLGRGHPFTNSDKVTYELLNEILNALNNKLMVGGIFGDLETAFNCVSHNILLSNLNFMASVVQFIS
jgi:hypothetical protein